MQGENRKRFDTLVRDLSADLFRYAFWLSRNRQVAEDLVQETFLRAWKSFNKLRDDHAAMSWLITILRREYARLHERRLPETVIVDNFDCYEDESSSSPPLTGISTDAFVLRRALGKLGESYREPLVLQVLWGFSCTEIAGLLGISQGAVMTRLFRARKQLRAILEDEPEIRICDQKIHELY